MRYNILVVYDDPYYTSWRQTMIDHLYSFAQYSEHNVFYLNLAYRENPPWHVNSIKFDLVIFHYIFIGSRWNDEAYQRSMKKAEFIKTMDAIKVILPQDEYYRSDYICRLINEYHIDYVFSVGPSSEWSQIYDKVDHNRVKFSTVLTGYIDPKTEKRIYALQKNTKSRDIDIGYRARNLPPWLGKIGVLKPLIADEFLKASKESLTTDISTRDQDTFYGDDWYKFLLRCKYTIGVEGGASLIDRTGELKLRTDEFVKNNPNASFEEIEASCFPGEDGYLDYVALSPRHLEACITKTCQVLVEGSYNGVLEPGKHYIELKKDFSNLNEVLEIIENDGRREEIVEKAFNDIVRSGRYTYKSLVENVISTALRDYRRERSNISTLLDSVVSRFNRLDDSVHPTRIRLIRNSRRMRGQLKKFFTRSRK